MKSVPVAFLVVDPGSPGERILPIRDRIFVGRECPGVEPDCRLILNDGSISRSHLEIRLDVQQNRAYVIDSSTNGTRINGNRIDRAVPVMLRPGDRISVGKNTKQMEFRSSEFARGTLPEANKTVANIFLTRMAMVVGDIISYSTISEYTDAAVLMENVGRLYGELLDVLTRHNGTVNNYVGDAFFAVWELEQNPSGVPDALRFAVAAAEMVTDLSPKLNLRDPDGNPIRMGWAVGEGLVGVSTLTGMLVALGDTTNLVFRISGLAGRDGRDKVLATESVRAICTDKFLFEKPEEVTVKGRKASERIYAARALVTGGA